MAGARRPGFATDDWMLEQQVRAEMEAEAWRRMREQATAPPAPAGTETPAAIPDRHRGGSAILKALVRFALAAAMAYLAYLAAVDSQLGEFEVWLAIGATFLVTLSLSMLGAAREFVHLLAEIARWAILIGAALGAAWFFMHMAS
ncbi:MAG: hypothetical protein AB7Q23_14955 [Hyphomonadaceae bacterium]